MISFNRFNGTKEDFELYKSSLGLSDEDIVFISDNATNKFIYANGTYFGSTEIYEGTSEPEDLSVKLWLDTNEPAALKYKNSKEEWKTVATGGEISSSPEIYIGDKQPESSDVVVWYDTSGNDEPTEPTTVTWDDINNKPEFADVAFTGDFNDLVNIPDFDLTRESCTIYASVDEEDPKHNLTHEQHLSNKDAFIKLRQSITDKQDIDITIVACYYSGEEVEYKDCYIKDVGYSSGTIINFQLESATIIQDINNPYLSYINISQFTNGNEYYQEGVTEPGTYVDVSKTYLVSYTDLNKHTTTYIGTENPSTISSKYNLWVDTTNEEVVFKYKEGNEWKVLSTGGNGSIEVDTVLDPTSENPIANKAVYAMAVSVEKGFSEIDENLSKKANTENGLVEGRGFKVSNTKKYYLPDTFVEGVEDVENTNILATKAEVLSNEVIDNKATVYNLYAMDDLSAEQLEANAKALESVQNREVAIYKVYTNDDTYAIADVKIVDGPYLEAYVYVNTPNTTDKQATITKYTYSFDQTGEYLPSDKDVEEIVVPSIDKVNELIGSGETGGSSVGGLETRIVYIPNYTSNNTTLTNEEKEYNLETCRKLLNGTARAALSLEGDTVGVYALNTYCEDILDLSVFGEEGYYIPFKWAYMVQLGATIIGNDGDILLFGGGQSTTVSDLILNEDLSNLADIGSAVMEQYGNGKLPMVYYVNQDLGSLLQLVPLHPFGTFSTLGVILQGIGESLDNTERTVYSLSCYNSATNIAPEFEATPVATRIYIGNPSTEHLKTNKAFANKPFGVLGISPMPALVYEDGSSAEILRWKSYQPLEKYIVPNLETGDWGDYTHIEFLIFREGKYERWKLDMEGVTSLIE